jgi:hypothetical protein
MCGWRTPAINVCATGQGSLAWRCTNKDTWLRVVLRPVKVVLGKVAKTGRQAEINAGNYETIQHGDMIPGMRERCYDS